MSHPEQLGFFAACVEANGALVGDARVLEIGSYDVNGSVRRLFSEASAYVGVDLVAGPGVDRVGDGSTIADPDGSWDIAVSGECFEHDPRWRETLAQMVRVTRPGGLVGFTCASTGRVEHGTTRTTAAESPGTQFVGLDYYKNVSAADVLGLPLDEWFSEWRVHYAPMAADLYFAGVRAGNLAEGLPHAALPPAESVVALAELMSARDRVMRAPLRLLALVVRREAWFQAVATRYWRWANEFVVSSGSVVNAVRRRQL